MYKLFNDNWEFAFKPIGELPSDSDFRPVDIPHDWQVHNTLDLYSTGDGWYRKRFVFAPGSLYELRFEGVYMDSEIYLNGEKIFEWKYGYTTFDVPIGSLSGENEISVRVRYQSPNTRWYSGAGIFRNIWLRETGENRIAPDGTYIVSYVGGRSWQTEIDTEIICSCAGTVRHTVFDADGEPVATTKMPFPEGTEKVSQTVEIDEPELWSTDRPYLYSVLTELVIGEESVDQRYERIGYKYVRFDKNEGFFLNGKSIKLNGACMHHDLGALGSAVNRAALRSQLLSLKDMGVNAIRTSHNPPSVEMMELCDELGILIDSEAFDMWELKKTDYDYARFFPEWHERDVRSWIRRDRNHPCVIMWSIGNEIYDTHASPRGVEITKELTRCVRLDDYKNAHPVTIGSNYMQWEGAQNCAKEIGAVGYNYAERLYDEHHRLHPDWVIYGSETASTVQSRGVYHFPASVSTTTHDDLQCSSLMNCATGWSAPTAEYNICEDKKRKFSLGQFIWTGWDYIGEPTPYSTKNSYFGHSDTAGFPKDTYFAYKAEWNKDAAPFVHLFPYWDFNEGQLIDLFIYSNCAKTELFVNGVSQGCYDHRSSEDRLSGRWRVPYHKGEIRAVGYDENGNKLCEQTRRSFGDPAKIVLKADKPTLFANGEDMIFVEVSTADAEGNPVENARNRINVTVEGAGRLLGMDNGDSSDYEQYKCCSRRLFSGKLLIMIGAKTEPGAIRLKVSSPDLPDETVEFRALEARIREGISCVQEVSCGTAKNDVSVRKIELSVPNQKLTPDCPETEIEFSIFPKNATFGADDIGIKAITETGVETNLLEIEKDGLKAKIKARGDGVYRLRAYCKNGTRAEEVISELEMENTGFGPASVNPYETVCASLCNNSAEFHAAMGGGVLTGGRGGTVNFGCVDFGNIGSDELTLGIYTYNENVIPVELLDENGELIATLNYQSKTQWNTYKYNTFRLPEKLRGVRGISFRISEGLRFKGFRFSKPRREGVELLAVENDGIYGDSYSQGEGIIERIGNNVSIIFNDIDLGKEVSAVEITGRTRNQKDTLHLRFDGEEPRIIEFEKSDEIVTRRFDIKPLSGSKNLTLVFLPGCDFDLKSIKFLK